jgi:H+/gluconate symporter-like permease
MGTYTTEFDLIGNPSIALLAGTLISPAVAKDIIQDLIYAAFRRAGVIIGIIMLDICGAGAFGYVADNSGIDQNIYAIQKNISHSLSLFGGKLAQGSRVVNAVISSQVFDRLTFGRPTLALLISAGAFMFLTSG